MTSEILQTAAALEQNSKLDETPKILVSAASAPKFPVVAVFSVVCEDDSFGSSSTSDPLRLQFYRGSEARAMAVPVVDLAPFVDEASHSDEARQAVAAQWDQAMTEVSESARACTYYSSKQI